MRLWLALCLSIPVMAQYQLESIISQSGTVAITHADDERLFLTLKNGRIRIWDGNQLLNADFLDLVGDVSTVSEQGLLSIAFHPNYAENGFAFVAYTDLNGDSTIARYTRDPMNPNRLDPNSARFLLQVGQPQENHNGGQLQFGPNGYLYYGIGDGGGANDPGCNAQDPQSLLGKMIRLDVDASVNTAPYHGIPASNPFVGNPAVRDEIWAIGLRNPWRFSFDTLNGDLYIADVGQNDYEEIDFDPAPLTGGLNYGWDRREGAHCFEEDANCPMGTPSCNDPSFTDPVIEYTHDLGRCSITGGYVYRGCDLPDLYGKYIYADYCSGDIWSAWRDQLGNWQTQLLNVSQSFITSFGTDADQELYLAGSGTIYRIDLNGLPTSLYPYWADTLPCGETLDVRALVAKVP